MGNCGIRSLLFLSVIFTLSCTSCGSDKTSELSDVETSIVTEITETSALSGGKISRQNGSDILEKGVCWSVGKEPTINDSHTSDGKGNSDFVSILTDLMPGTRYYVRAYAKNSEGLKYGDEKTFVTRSENQIIADHSVVDQFDKIPQHYIDEVKKMWVVIAGESHSQAYRTGLAILEEQFPVYAVSITESGEPEGPSSSYLRFSRATWGDVNNETGWIYDYGEEDWFTNETAVTRTKASLLHCHNSDLGLTVFGFGWCYDATYPGVSGKYNSEYGTRWGGATVGSPEGEKVWGLGREDQALTGNSVSMQTYVDATKEYIAFCNSNNIPTKVIFTTGPVDTDYVTGLNTGEVGYQQFLKWEYIRNSVRADKSAILFDYADILSYNNAATIATTTWKDRNGVIQTYPLLHPDNERGETTGHIGSEGAIRLAKAMWWMLARIAGWDGK